MPNPSSDNGCDELLISLGWVRMYWCLLSSLALGLAGVFVYIYYLRKGQFDDAEDVKYQMFHDDD